MIMTKYNVVSIKDNQLLLSFITYDKKLEKKLLDAFKKMKRQVNVYKVETWERKI